VLEVLVRQELQVQMDWAAAVVVRKLFPPLLVDQAL
jgi:hypothetical protein